MEPSSCFCGGEKYTIRKRLALNAALSNRGRATAEIRRCTECGLMRTFPTPVTGVDSDLYGREDIPAAVIAEQELWRDFSRQVLARLRAFKASGRLLDVGCSIGLLVDEARKLGYDAEGVDLNPRAISFGAERLGVPLRCQTIESIPGEAQYDVIVMNHTIEHIHDLRSFLGHCARLLKADGVLFSVCPNAEGGVPRFLDLLNRRQSGSGSHWIWYGYLPEEHVWQFAPATLRAVFEACGYDVLGVEARENMYYGATQLRGLRYKVMGALWRAFELLGIGDNLAIAARPRHVRTRLSS